MFKDCIQAYIHTMYTIKTLESLLPNMSFIICAYSRDTNLKLQYFGHLMRSVLTGKDPDAGRDWGQEEKGATRGWDSWMVSRTQWTWVWANYGRWWRTEKPGVLQSVGSQRVGHNLATEQQPQLKRKALLLLLKIHFCLPTSSPDYFKYIFLIVCIMLQYHLPASFTRPDHKFPGSRNWFFHSCIPIS